MAEYGEWNRKGATLSDVTAKKEYGVDRDFIVKGIRGGKLEYREGVIRRTLGTLCCEYNYVVGFGYTSF
jgi:hypothetical protein